jgi:zinc/manganese transport system ATP-binding protein
MADRSILQDSAAHPDPAVLFTDATARFGGHDIWSHVDLAIEAGTFAAVLGPNGSGKSTLINAVLGLVPLAEGKVEVLGRPPGEAGGDIGYLPQRRSFDPTMRVRGIDVVRLGADGDKWGVPLPWGTARRARDARVEEVIDLVGAGAYAGRPIGEVSGGEQQRLLIAQALVRRPRLLLLDEPFDSLDLPNQGAVAALIAEISQQFRITVLFVAHDVNPIASALDGVIYVAQGRAVSGSPEEVITSETLSDLYGTPIEVLTTSDGRRVVVGQPDASSHHAGHHGPHDHGPHAGHDHTTDEC